MRSRAIPPYFFASMIRTLRLRVLVGPFTWMRFRLCMLSKRSSSRLPFGLSVRRLPVSSSENDTGVSRATFLQWFQRAHAHEGQY